jgi:para-nitrobenzyl esterase
MIDLRIRLLTLSLVVVAVPRIVPASWPPAGDSSVRAQAAPCLVSTAYGTVAGISRDLGCTYLGVPYAAPPTGGLRWRPPQRRAPWAPTVLSATVAAQACSQINLAGAPAGNEDCLTLNIWTPVTTASSDLPVMIWFHPGSFVAASSNLAASDGRRFAEQRRVIVVAPNYRLGPFGFLALDALASEDPGHRASGNYGVADQRAAMAWVRENIEAFGGNPRNVTIAGTSAGGVSTTLHLISPASRGLFGRAIAQSGTATTRLPSTAEATAQGDAFAAALGCSDPASLLSCLRSKTRDQVLTALPLAGLTGGLQQLADSPGRVLWGPVVDGVEIPEQPRTLFRRGLFSRVPLLIGTNDDDGFTFVDRSFPSGLDTLQYERTVQTEFGIDTAAILNQYPAGAYPSPKDALARLTTDVEFACEARRVARAMHDDGAPVFVYSFEYPVNAVNPGRAFHGLEANLLFGNNFGAPSNHVLTPADLVVFDAMSTYWSRFAENGDPNPRGAPVQWPPYRPDRSQPGADPTNGDYYFVFGPRLGVNTSYRDARCNFWEPFFYRTAVGAAPAAAR